MVVIEHLNNHSLNLHKINKAMPLLDSQARPDIEIEPRPEIVSSNSQNRIKVFWQYEHSDLIRGKIYLPNLASLKRSTFVASRNRTSAWSKDFHLFTTFGNPVHHSRGYIREAPAADTCYWLAFIFHIFLYSPLDSAFRKGIAISHF